MLVLIGLLLVIDLVGVGLRYVNEDDFIRRRLVTEPFTEQTFDKQILEDTGIYRVYDPQEGINGARTSYFHKSIGGYHAAKPRATQELFEHQIYQGNLQILNMLNVKYVIQRSEEGAYAVENPDALGNAWFISNLISVKSANEEMTQLDNLNVANTAVINAEKFPGTKWATEYTVDSLAAIELETYRPNYLVYRATNKADGLAVFSEMYYPQGWKAFLNGKEVPHFQVNYALRAMLVPAGENRIEFKFEPEVVETGKQITWAGSLLFALIAIAGLIYSFQRKKEQ